MSDIPPTAPPLPEPTWLQRTVTAMLPQFVAFSRKGLVWFSGLTAVGIAELAKYLGDILAWTPEHIQRFSNEMLLIQGLVMVAAKWWTDQIKEEDKALKTGLPPPAAAAQVITNVAAPAPVVQPQPLHMPGLPPGPPRGQGG